MHKKFSPAEAGDVEDIYLHDLRLRLRGLFDLPVIKKEGGAINEN